MKETLKKLIALQEIDARAFAFKVRRDEIPNQIQEQVRAVDRAEDKLKEVEGRNLELKKAIDRQNLDMKGFEEKIYKCEVDLNSITTNDAYKAMVAQIAGFKADKSRVEDRILDMSYQQDEMKEHIVAAKKDVDAARREHDTRKSELDEQAGVLGDEVGKLMADREGQLEGIDREVLGLYERILERRRGSALAPVRDQHCQGCQMNLTLQEMTLLLNCKEILTCRTCSRILYLEEVLAQVS